MTKISTPKLWFYPTIMVMQKRFNYYNQNGLMSILVFRRKEREVEKWEITKKFTYHPNIAEPKISWTENVHFPRWDVEDCYKSRRCFCNVRASRSRWQSAGRRGSRHRCPSGKCRSRVAKSRSHRESGHTWSQTRGLWVSRRFERLL